MGRMKSSMMVQVLLWSICHLTASAARTRRAVQGHQDQVLRNSDFSAGTYIIDTPGAYTLGEDISFNPDDPMPSISSDKYRMFSDESHLGGYMLGYFAAIVIVADDVTLDCGNHLIEQSEAHHRIQRFFSVIELSSKAFPAGSGPPQFKADTIDMLSANSVTIQNCRIGRSSHHGIHGNNNEDVTITNTEIFDFEVGGIHLNGGTDLVISHVNVGPSLSYTYSRELANLAFNLNVIEAVRSGNTGIEHLIQRLTWRNQIMKDMFDAFKTDMQEYWDSKSGKISDVVKSGILPDGSALYGIVLHRKGSATGQFAKAPNSEESVRNIELTNITIRDLDLKREDFRRAWYFSANPEMRRMMQGPSGDLIDWPSISNWRRPTTSSGQYEANYLSEVQFALAKLASEVESRGLHNTISRNMLSTAFAPAEAIDWAEGGEDGMTGVGLNCGQDIQGHTIKGVIGLFLTSVIGKSSMQDVTIKDIRNSASSRNCLDPETMSPFGADTYGGFLKDCFHLDTNGLSVSGLSVERIDATAHNIIKED